MKKLLIGGAALLVSAAAIAQVAPAPVAASQTKAAKVHTRAEVQAKVAEHFAKARHEPRRCGDQGGG